MNVAQMLGQLAGIPEPEPVDTSRKPDPPEMGRKATAKKRVKLPKHELKRRASQSKRDRKKGGRKR